jgi:hypothetical protein
MGVDVSARPQTDSFVNLISSTYRPCPLPIRVALLTTPLSAQRHERLWRYYATRDLHVFRLLSGHHDVMRPDVQCKLAQVLEQILMSQQESSRC